MAEALSVHMGREAADRIARDGWSPEHFDLLLGASGGAKWLITRNSLDARIAEERLIDASLMQETGANGSDQGRTDTGADGFAPVRNDPLVDLLKEQLAL